MLELQTAFIKWLARSGRSTDTSTYSDQQIRDLTATYKDLNRLDGDQLYDLRFTLGVIF